MPKTYIRYDKKILVKLSKAQKQKLEVLAKIYSDGNVSRFIRSFIDNRTISFVDKEGKTTYPPKG